MSERLFIVIMDFMVFGIKWTLKRLNLHKNTSSRFGGS